MKRFEVCVVRKHYHWLEIEAIDELEAEKSAWVKLKFIEDVKPEPEHIDVEIYVEGEVSK